jgi:hypothetical protein
MGVMGRMRIMGGMKTGLAKCELPFFPFFP